MSYHIAKGGMGGAFNPPGHAEHNWFVRETNGRGTEVGSLALSYAITQSYVPEHIKKAAQRLLDENPGTHTPEWEAQVYRHWHNCWSTDGSMMKVADLIIDAQLPHRDPKLHAGYCWIRKFFPDAKPRLDLI